MFQNSIRRKIVSIAVGLIILMVITSALSMLMEAKVGHLLDEQTNKYIPAYSHLARANIRSLERAIALRRMVIAKLHNSPDEIGYAERLKIFDQKGPEIEQEAEAARKLIVAIINDVSTPSDNAALARIETRIENAVNDLRHRMNDTRTLRCLPSSRRGIWPRSEGGLRELTRSATSSTKRSI